MDEEDLNLVFNAWKMGQLSPEQTNQFASGVESGQIQLPDYMVQDLSSFVGGDPMAAWSPAPIAQRYNPYGPNQSQGSLAPSPPAEQFADVNQRYSDLNFVQRGLSPQNYPQINNPDGSYSTHKLAAEVDDQGDWWVFPTIVQGPDGKLIELPIEQAKEFAVRTGERVGFGKNKDDALAYSQNGLINHGGGDRDQEGEFWGNLARGAGLAAKSAAPYLTAAGVGMLTGTPMGAGIMTGATALAKFLDEPVTKNVMWLVNDQFGTNFKSPFETFEAVFEKAGVEAPKNKAERMTHAVNEFMVDTMATLGTGAAIKVGAGMIGALGELLFAEPAAQAAGAVIGAVASNQLSEMKAPWWAQLAGTLGAGMLGSQIPRGVRGVQGARMSQEAFQNRPASMKSKAALAVDEMIPEMTAEASKELDRVKSIATDAVGSPIDPKTIQARRELAEMAQANPEARKAAEQLGMELPPDVLSDDTQLRMIAGLTRSAQGSEAEAAWFKSYQHAVDQADEAMKKLGAVYSDEGGRISTGIVSDEVKSSLDTAQKTLKSRAKALYRDADKKIKDTSPVRVETIRRVVDEIAQGVDERLLSKHEKELKEILGNAVDGEATVVGGIADDLEPPKRQEVTYGTIRRIKDQVGKALDKEESLYSNLSSAQLKRLYGAIARDQAEAVLEYGGKESLAKWYRANKLVAERKNLEAQIVDFFGKDMTKGIGGKIKSAMVSAVGGDYSGYDKLIKVVPPKLQRKVVLTGLASAMKSNQALTNGRFGFTEFAKIYPNLKSNPTIFADVAKHVGPSGIKVLDSLEKISRRMSESMAAVQKTGKSNQAFLQVEGLLTDVMTSAVSQGIAKGVGTLAGGMIGNKFADAVVKMTTTTERNAEAMNRLGALLSSPRFNALVDAASKNRINPTIVRDVARSSTFSRFYQSIKARPGDLNQKEKFLYSALNSLRGEALKEKESE